MQMQPVLIIAQLNRLDNMQQEDMQESQMNITNNQSDIEAKAKACDTMRHSHSSERDKGQNIARSRYGRGIHKPYRFMI